MSEKEFLALYEQYLQGKCTPEEVYSLENYGDDFQWKTWTSGLGDKERIHNEIYHRLRQEVQPNHVRRTLFPVRWMVAASLILIAGAGISLFYVELAKVDHHSAINAAQFETRAGEKKQIRLQDGTTVWLNAQSKLVLAKDFNGDTRNVDLIGEAYFDVAHSKDKPFKVHTRAFNINVLGTAFNVKAYPAELNATATLIRGSISMRGLSPEAKVITLKPSEKVEFLNPGAELIDHQTGQPSNAIQIQHYTQRNDSVIVETAWKNNNLEIYDQTFAELKNVLERWFDVEIIIKSNAVKNYRFRANFNNESITEVLKSLQKAQYFNYEMKDRTVTISE